MLVRGLLGKQKKKVNKKTKPRQLMLKVNNIILLWRSRARLTRTISASNRFGRLQMLSEPDIRQCANEDNGLQRGGL